MIKVIIRVININLLNLYFLASHDEIRFFKVASEVLHCDHRDKENEYPESPDISNN